VPILTNHENLVYRKGTKNLTIKIQVPKDVRQHFGNKSNIWISTKTPDLKVAGYKRDMVVAEYKLKFRAFREGGTPAVIQDKINEGRKLLARIQEDMAVAMAKENWDEADSLDGAHMGIRDQYQYEIEKLIAPSGIPNITGVNNAWETALSEQDYVKKVNPAIAKQLHGVDEQLLGKDAHITVAIDEWYEDYSKTVKEKIANEAYREIEYLAQNFDRVSEINYDSIMTYIRMLRLKGNKGTKGNSKDTIKKKLNWLRSYWRYLQQEKIIPRTTQHVIKDVLQWQTPFDGHDVKTIATDFTDVLHYEPEEMLKIWRYIRENKSEEMLEVITAQMFTGARVSECINHINDKDITEKYIMIQKGKTKGARRQVPIHSMLKPLLVTLKAKGYFKVTSKNISNDFMDIRKACGFVADEEANTKYDMHSIRHTVCTLMERGRIAETTIEQIVGHKPKSIIGKHYSGGVLIEDKMIAIETVQYPFTEEELQFVQNGLK
jgi:integrase